MDSSTLSVFYGADLLPYKDSARTIHYPVTGSTFAGSNDTKKIRFFVKEIGGTTAISWVVVSKLPNGQVGYDLLSTVGIDSLTGEPYLLFDVSSYYTQYKGIVKLALRGYSGVVNFTDEDDEGNPLPNDQYRVVGNPLIEVTGTIDLAINYSPMVDMGHQILPTDIDRILASLSGYIKNGDGIIVIPNLSVDIEGRDLQEGQLFYCVADKCFYILSDGLLVFYEMNVIDVDTSGTLTTNQLKQAQKANTVLRYSPSANTYIFLKKSKTYSTGIYFEGIEYNFANLDTSYSFGEKIYQAIISTTTREYSVSTKNLGIPTTTYTIRSNVTLSTSNMLFTLFVNHGQTPFICSYSGEYYIARFWKSGTTYTFAFTRLGNNQGHYGQNYAGVTTTDLSVGQMISSTYKVEYLTDENVYTKTESDQRYLINDLPIDNDTTLGDVYSSTGGRPFICTLVNRKYLSRVRYTGGQYSFSFICIDNDLYNDVGFAYIGHTYDNELVSIVTSGSTYLVRFATQTYVDNAISSLGDVLEFKGSTYVASINAMTSQEKGDVWNLLDGGTLNNGLVVNAGDNIVWTGSTWDLFSASVDVSSLVPNTRTIAGISLASNISAQDLTNALVLMNLTTDVDYVMED